ncbi:MAG: phosphoribosylanthranilate isomerase [Bradyrhizobiaceae bacterium]|nr:MAG: phosphoribosylanthranilate isomerase [Bradyrhizobiaceae bacterium]
MSLIVKICGLSTSETLSAALDAGADMVGFVFFEASPRHLSLEAARKLGREVGVRAQKVALTVDADDATLANIIETLRPDWLQLHGQESVARVRDIRQRYDLPVMKVIGVKSKDDLAPLPGYAAVADRIMFDARAPKDATRPGGLGVPFDWHVLDGATRDQSFILSGGLTIANVAEAIRIARPGGVDVSSGVERAPGAKDSEMIRAFIRAAREAEINLSEAISHAR